MYLFSNKTEKHIGLIALQTFKDNLEFKLQVNSRRLHKVRFNKSHVNIKLNKFKKSPVKVKTDGLHKTSFG